MPEVGAIIAHLKVTYLLDESKYKECVCNKLPIPSIHLSVYLSNLTHQCMTFHLTVIQLIKALRSDDVLKRATMQQT